MQVNPATQYRAANATDTNTKATDKSKDKSKDKSATGMDALAQESTFLKLLVAQMKYQDPTNPTDSMQYLQQMSQYASLEQLTQMNSKLENLPGNIVKALTTADTSTNKTGK